MPTKTTFTDMWDQIRTIVETESKRFDEKWIIRKRIIDTKLLVIFIFQLVLSKNKQGYGTALALLWKNCSEAGVPLVSPHPVSASSICEARQKLSEEIFTNIQEKIVRNWEEHYDRHFLWKNHRIFTVDGSKLNLPRELIEDGYEVPGGGAYYPQGLLSCLYRAGCALPYAWNFASHADERRACSDLLENLRPEDILILDRGYYSFELMSKCKSRGIIPIFRLSGAHLKNERKGKKGDDFTITVYPNKQLIKKVKDENLPISLDPIEVRIVNYKAEETDFSIATFLSEEKHPKDAVADLYWLRWGEEELYKVSKVVVEVEDFHGKTELGVKQELSAHFVLITIARIAAIHTELELNLEASPDDPPKGESGSSLEICQDLEQSSKPSNEKALNIAEKGIPLLSLGVLKVNFKASLSLLGDRLETLIASVAGGFQGVLDDFLEAMKRLKYKFRPLRSFPRRSRKPDRKWRPARA